MLQKLYFSNSKLDNPPERKIIHSSDASYDLDSISSDTKAFMSTRQHKFKVSRSNELWKMNDKDIKVNRMGIFGDSLLYRKHKIRNLRSRNNATKLLLDAARHDPQSTAYTLAPSKKPLILSSQIYQRENIYTEILTLIIYFYSIS